MIALIEDAIKARLAAAKLPYLRTVATYAGQFDGDLAQVVRAYPAVWVSFKGEDRGKSTGTRRAAYTMAAVFLVMVGARNLRCEEAARHGGPTGLEIGTYQMLADVRALLVGQDFGLAIDRLAPGRTVQLINGKTQGQGLSVLAQEWHTSYTLHVPRVQGGADVVTPAGGDSGTTAGDAVPGGSGNVCLPVLPVLESVNLDYHLLPDDGQSDALDVLTLQEGRESA